MKTLFTLLLLTVSLSVMAQSFYNPRGNTKISYRDTEAFSVTFKKTMQSLVFKPNDRVLTPAIKAKIERFMATTNRTEFKGFGAFTLHIIKRQDIYYVLCLNASNGRGLEKLIEL